MSRRRNTHIRSWSRNESSEHYNTNKSTTNQPRRQPKYCREIAFRHTKIQHGRPFETRFNQLESTESGILFERRKNYPGSTAENNKLLEIRNNQSGSKESKTLFEPRKNNLVSISENGKFLEKRVHHPESTKSGQLFERRKNHPGSFEKFFESELESFMRRKVLDIPAMSDTMKTVMEEIAEKRMPLWMKKAKYGGEEILIFNSKGKLISFSWSYILPGSEM